MSVTNLCVKFLDDNASKFLEHYYKCHITRAKEREVYFQKYGGEDWQQKYKSCADYKYYQECITGKLFEEELEQIKKYALIDMLEIIKNNKINLGIDVENYSDIYYTFEQFEYIYRHYCN